MLLGLESVSKESVGVRVSRSKCVAWVHLPKPQRTGDLSPSRPSGTSNEPWIGQWIEKRAKTYPIAFQCGRTVLLALAKTVCTFALVKDVWWKFTTLQVAATHRFEFSPLHTQFQGGRPIDDHHSAKKSKIFPFLRFRWNLFSLFSCRRWRILLHSTKTKKPAKKLQPIESKIKPHLTEIERNWKFFVVSKYWRSNSMGTHFFNHCVYARGLTNHSQRTHRDIEAFKLLSKTK